MHTSLLYPNGRRADGFILSISEDTMRVVLKRSADTVELRRVGGDWTSEDGSRIEFESLLIAGDIDLLRHTQTKPLALAAGAQAFLPV
jgi:hypothetical protein